MQISLQDFTNKKLNLKYKWKIVRRGSIVGHKYVYALLFNKTTMMH